MKVVVSVLLALVYSNPVALAAGGPSLEVDLDENQILTVCGTPAGGEYLVWGIGYRRHEFYSVRSRAVTLLTTPEHDGCYRYDPDLLAPYTLVAVDRFAQTVEAVTDPGGGHRLPGEATPLFEATWVDRGLRLAGPTSVEVLLIRPGGQVFLAVAVDGGEGDGDGRADGVITLTEQSFRGLGESPKELAAFAAGDVAAVFDLDTLALVVTPSRNR